MKIRNTVIFLLSIMVLSAGLWGVKAKAAAPDKQDESLGIDFGSTINISPMSGYLEGTTGFDKITLTTEDDPTYVIFFWDDTPNPSVRVYGESYNLLDTFVLGDIDTITLSGAGTFNLELYARSGYGSWSCDALNEFDYQMTYGDFMQDIIAAPTSGYLSNTSETDEIKVDSIVDPAHAVFEWESGMELWVKVLSEDRSLLGEFNLDNGNVIDLKGTGIFFLQLNSKYGYGDWSVEFMNDEDYNSSYSETSYDLVEIKNSVMETTEKTFVSDFLHDMIAYDLDKLKSYISPKYLSDNNLNIKDYIVNTYSPVDFAVDGFNSYTGIVDSRIWGSEQSWMHALEFKVVQEDGKYYLYPSEHGGEYIHPWHSVTTGIK